MDNGCSRYDLIDYYEVYQDEFGLWQVNNQFVRERNILMADDATDDEILTYLVNENHITNKDFFTVEDYAYGMIEICAKETGCPMLSLRRVS